MAGKIRMLSHMMAPDQKSSESSTYHQQKSHHLQSLNNLNTMLEFTPFNPFAAYRQSYEEEEVDLAPSQNYSQDSNSMIDVEEYKPAQETETLSVASTQKRSTASEYHNMTKQLVITMKQIMGRYIKDIGSTASKRTIIQNIWLRLTKKKHPTKLTLKLLFDAEVNVQLLKREELIDSVGHFDSEDFRQAMVELKEELIMRMKESAIRSNLIDRRISKKDVLLAYIQHFLHEQLELGDIKARFGPNGATKIKKILNKTKKDEDFISDFLF